MGTAFWIVFALLAVGLVVYRVSPRFRVMVLNLCDDITEFFRLR